MKQNGESIYGTTAGPFPKAPAWGRVTQKPDKLYLHVFDWPKDRKLTVPAIGKKVTAVYLLADPDLMPLPVTVGQADIQIECPRRHPTRSLRWWCWNSGSKVVGYAVA